MRNSWWAWPLTLAGFALLPPVDALASDATAETPGIDPPPVSSTPWSLCTTAASRYLFQGIDYSEGRPVIQPQATVGWKGTTLAFWGNWDMDRGDLDEIDLSLQHTLDTQAFSLTAGLVDLRYPHREGWAPTHEVFADFAWNTTLNPSVSTHYDFEAAKGAYITFSLSQALGGGSAPVTVSTRLFWQSRYYEMTGIPAAEVNLGIELTAGGLGLAPSISRFFTWENGTFRGEDAVRASWVFTLSLSRGS